MEKLLEQEAMMEEDQKVRHYLYVCMCPPTCFAGQEATVDRLQPQGKPIPFACLRLHPHHRISCRPVHLLPAVESGSPVRHPAEPLHIHSESVVILLNGAVISHMQKLTVKEYK